MEGGEQRPGQGQGQGARSPELEGGPGARGGGRARLELCGATLPGLNVAEWVAVRSGGGEGGLFKSFIRLQ